MRVNHLNTRIGGLDQARLVFATWGQLNADGDNAVLLPSYFTGNHTHYAPLIGAGRALDPTRYFIVAPNLFGNGISTSPSHDVAWSSMTIEDNIHAQHELLRHLGVQRLALAAGWSLGAMQALHFAMLYPAMVTSVVAICGTGFCWPINTAFLRGVVPILESSATIDEQRALDLFGRAYCGWAYSADFFRNALYRNLGFASIDALLDDWAKDHQQHRAADLLAILNAWANTARPTASARTALGQITARCFIVPCDSDGYFTVEDARFEANAIEQAVFRPMTSPYGHCAGAPGRFATESAYIETIFTEALYETASKPCLI